MKITTAILLASVSLSALNHAMAADPTIRVISWSPTERTEIVGVIDQPTTITFPVGENVYRVVQSVTIWEGPDPEQVKDTPLGNNLTLWPKKAGESVMTVITMPSTGIQKVYNFRLVARPNDPGAIDAPDVVFNLVFKGGTATAAPPPATSITTQAVSATVQADPPSPLVARPTNPRLRAWAAALNPPDGLCHFAAQGRWPSASAIQPHCPMSDGQWTWMRFPGLTAKPAVYIVGSHGGERLARQHGDSDFVVVEEIAPRFRLRLGPDVLDIINYQYSRAGRPTGTGSINTSIERDILTAGRR